MGVVRNPAGDHLPAWMTAPGPASDVVLSSRVRLARNLVGEPFPPRADLAAAGRVSERAAAAIRAMPRELGSFRFLRMADLSSLDRQVLVEEHLISPLLALQAAGALALRQDEAVAIMINEEDHLRIQCLYPGLQPVAAWRLADQVDDALERSLEYAFSEEWGYLAASPANVGTGMRASLMMHLPGLVLSGQAAALFANLQKVGVVVRGLYGEGSAAVGNLFQVSNQVSLGLSEEEIAHNLEALGRQIADRERSARERLYAERRAQIEDRAARAYGLLTSARLMASAEAAALLSDLRLGIDLHVLPQLDPLLFNELMVTTRPAFVQRWAPGADDPGKRDEVRATLIRQRLAEAARGRSAAGG
jgi:protein arginine kinase